MKKLFAILLISICFIPNVFSQTEQNIENKLSGYTNPDELVTLSSTLPFSQAVDLLSKVSESVSGKRIISRVQNNAPIGLELNNVPYRQALSILVNLKGLTFEETPDLLIIKSKTESGTQVQPAGENYASVDSREVKISAVFFEMDVSKAKERGVDWEVILSGKSFNIGASIGITGDEGQSEGGTTPAVEAFQLENNSNFNTGGLFGQATALFRFFENEQLGEIISNPNITTRDGQEARLQVGQDFSIKQRDFAGNVIEQFFSVGTIISVTPYVFNEEGIDYVLLNIKAERSSILPDPDRTILSKTQANTQVKLLNGEETVIGGLFTNEEIQTRNGVPILKDLPWWVLGLRYIFGYDDTNVEKKELVILIKAELVPTLKERLASGIKNSEHPIREEVNKRREQLKLYHFNEQETSTIEK